MPGLRTDWEKKPWNDLVRKVEPTECDETRLRAELEKLPGAVTGKSGKSEGDPYFTDGLRAVIELTSEPTDLSEVDVLDWLRPAVKQ